MAHDATRTGGPGTQNGETSRMTSSITACPLLASAPGGHAGSVALGQPGGLGVAEHAGLQCCQGRVEFLSPGREVGLRVAGSRLLAAGDRGVVPSLISAR